MKKSKTIFNMAIATTMAASAIVAVAPSQADAAQSFPDVKETNSHYENIMNLVERGIINGYEDGTFKPGESIKRGHAAKIIAGVLGLETKNVKDPGFKDISTKNPYYGAIAALANAGIINGFEDNTYRHNDTLTRGQMAKIIANAFELEAGDTENPFTDVKNSQYADYITALFVNGVTTGKTETTFDAKSPVTRAQLASFVVRAENVKADDQEQAVTAKILEVTDTTVVTDKGTFAIEGDLTKVFNANNAAALKNAIIEVVVDSELTASLNFVAAGESKLSTLKSLTLVVDNSTFNAGGFEIPQLTVSGKSIEIQNVKVTTLTVGQGLTLKLTNVEVSEFDATKGAKITLDPTSTIGKITLPKNLKITDVITNYNQVKDLIKEVTVDENSTAPSTGGGGGGGSNSNNDDESEATNAKSAVNKLISKLIDDNAEYYEAYGELTGTAPSFKFNFDDNYQDKTLQVIKNEVEGTGSSIEVDVLDIVTLDNLGHLLNIDQIKATSNGKSSTLFNGLPESTPLDEVKDYLADQLNQATVADALDEFMDHDTARDTTVSEFIDQYNKFDIVVTFSDNSTLNYTVNLEK